MGLVLVEVLPAAVDCLQSSIGGRDATSLYHSRQTMQEHDHQRTTMSGLAQTVTPFLHEAD